MKESIESFFKILTAQLKFVCEGKYDATDEVLKFTDTSENDSEVSELAETVGLMSVKLEAREMALEKTIAELEQNLSDRRRFGIFFILFTFFISIFTFVSAYLNQSTLTTAQVDIVSPLIGLTFLLFLIVLAFVQIHLGSFSIKDFGLTFQGSRKAIKESLLVTAVVVALMTLVRWWCGNNLEVFQGKPFFDVGPMGYSFWTFFFVAPGQEFIARGMVQTVLHRLMAGKYAALWAITLTALMFAVAHTFFSFWISVVSIFAGIMWGWLYMRHNTIVGVSISHFIIQSYAELLGFWFVLR